MYGGWHAPFVVKWAAAGCTASTDDTARGAEVVELWAAGRAYVRRYGNIIEGGMGCATACRAGAWVHICTDVHGALLGAKPEPGCTPLPIYP